MKKPSPRVLGGALFVIIAVGVITNWHLLVSLAVTLSADGTNESLYLNPTGTGKVVVGGDSLVLATKTSEPSSPSTGQVYFDTTTGTFRGYTGSGWVDLNESLSNFPVSGLISYWKFNESSTGASAADAHSSNTLLNNNSTPYVAALLNNGSDLESGSNNYFSISDALQTGLDISGDFSISMWVKPESDVPNPGGMGLLSKWNGSYAYALYLGDSTYYSGGDYIILVYSSDGGSTNTSARINNTMNMNGSTWYHLVATVDADSHTIAFYLNGVSQAVTYEGTAATSVGDTSAPFEIGRMSGSSDQDFDGIIDEVGIWNRALSAQEIEDLYNEGSGISY